MCRAAASTDGFLRFTAKDISTYKFVWQMLVYAVAAAVIMVLFITVPAVSYTHLDVYKRQVPAWALSRLVDYSNEQNAIFVNAIDGTIINLENSL